MTTLKVAACQMKSGLNVPENLATADRLIADAAAAGARLVALPEYFYLMGCSDYERVAQREPVTHPMLVDSAAPIQAFLARAARRHQVWLAGGTAPLEAPERSKFYNTTLLFDPEGRRVGRYDKIHLFKFEQGTESYDESLTIVPGDRPSVLELPIGRVGLSICYDLRFPELYRSMGKVDLLMVPAAFTWGTGRAHWEILLRARAIENQCYVLAPAQGGEHDNGRRTWGHTMLVDPWGGVVAERIEDGAGIVVGDLNFERMADVRRRLPALEHRTDLQSTGNRHPVPDIRT